MKKRSLPWGCTPWDAMTREELLREMQRAYAAVNAAHAALAMLGAAEPSPYWQQGGTGHRALAMCRAVVARVEDRFKSEDVYRSFFRYAVDLLFTPEFGAGWRICPSGHMLGDARRTIEACSICKAPMRALEWSDLAPEKGTTP